MATPFPRWISAALEGYIEKKGERLALGSTARALGVSVSDLHALASGERQPTKRIMQCAAAFFSVSPDLFTEWRQICEPLSEEIDPTSDLLTQAKDLCQGDLVLTGMTAAQALPRSGTPLARSFQADAVDALWSALAELRNTPTKEPPAKILAERLGISVDKLEKLLFEELPPDGNIASKIAQLSAGSSGALNQTTSGKPD